MRHLASLSLILALLSWLSLAAFPTLAQTPTMPSTLARVVTEHTLTLNGHPLEYTATVGFERIPSDSGLPQADMFYIAYAQKGTNALQRPITFVFNGGPGSSSIWLHLGAAGPKRVLLSDEGLPITPPQLVDNAFTWLGVTDLVFIDPVGTGFSRATSEADTTKFYDVEQDARSIAEFIRLYLIGNDRWLSPKFIAGESYGGTRAILVTRLLRADFGININGLILISPVIDYETLNVRPTDLSLALAVPTYAAVARYHKRLAVELQARDLQSLLDQVERWSIDEYLPALVRGDALPNETRAQIARDLSSYTGIAESAIIAHHLHLAPRDFATELLQDHGLEISFYDGRLTFGRENRTDYIGQLTPIFVPAFNTYLRSELGYFTDRRYIALSSRISRQWNWGPGGLTGFFTVTADLREIMQNNPALKILVARGDYDLNVPYFGTEYALNQLDLSPELRANLIRRHYGSGHMLYTARPAAQQLKADVAALIQNAQGKAILLGTVYATWLQLGGAPPFLDTLFDHAIISAVVYKIQRQIREGEGDAPITFVWPYLA